MKTVLAGTFSAIFLTICIAISAQEVSNVGQKFEFAKEKVITKTYPAPGNKLAIDNSLGNIKFVTWEKSEIQVDVHIEASSDHENVAQKLFEALQVSDKQQGNEISFTTKIDNNDNSCKSCKSTMRIDYEVHLPTSVALNVGNSFGSIDIPDYSGTLSITSKFGQLTTGSLSNVKELVVDFGRASIKKLSNVSATFNSSDIEIANLGGKNKMKLEFCNATNIKLDSDLMSLDLHGSYSSVYIRPGDLAATYSISTSYGSVIDRSYANIHRTDQPDKNGPDGDKMYEGKSGSGSAKINISSNFGKIIIEPNADDLKEIANKSQDTTKN